MVRPWKTCLADPKLFNSETYTPEVAAKLQRYRKLAGKPASSLSARERSALKKLATEFASQQIPEMRRSQPLDELQRILKKHKL